MSQMVRYSSRIESAGQQICEAIVTERSELAYWIGMSSNLAGGGSMTAGHSHGYPLDLKKRAVLAKWADLVERLATPVGAALLR